MTYHNCDKKYIPLNHNTVQFSGIVGKGISKKVKIDAAKYVNTDTGELLSSENGMRVGSINVLRDDIVRLTSEEFVITDTRTMDYLRDILGKSDIGYVRMMVDMVYGNFNLIYDRVRRVPHTNKTLMVDLELANTAFYGLMQRLYKKGVLYYVSGYNNGRYIKHIMLNPTIGRRTNQIQRECLKYFEDLSQKKTQISNK